VPVDCSYYREDDVPGQEMIEHFGENAAESEATMRRVSEAGPKEAITQACQEREIRRLVVPPGVPKVGSRTAWRLCATIPEPY
jgi:L-lactate utilization protein LutC